ncbi:MAG TPA: sulfatase [Bacteroidales bacterium]|nr:sulfatase [Bacteroidales bacterium]
MKNFKGIVIFTGLTGLMAACTNSPAEKKEQKSSDISKAPNIILLVSDDHGRGDLGCWGNQAVRTPNLDALASEGVRMTNAYCTSASCSASRSVILTGIYNHANGQYGHQHAFHHFSAFSGIKSLSGILSDNGYATARAGKYHLAPEEVFRFDTVLSYDNRNDVEMAATCRNFIEKAGEPFFLYFCSDNPHRSGEYATNLPGKPNRFGNRDEGYPGVQTHVFNPDSVIVPPYLPDTPECRAELAQYYQSVDRMDQGIGKILSYVRESGKWDNTVIIYISDNGIAFPGAKTTLYDPGMHLPCIVKYPGSKNTGGASDAMITWADITPTLLDFAGILPTDNTIPGMEGKEPPQHWKVPYYVKFQGHSFKDALDDEHPKRFDEIFASHTFHEITMYYPMKVVQNRHYKLIWNVAWQLPYPHATDLWSSPTWQSALNSGTGLYAGKKISVYNHRPQFELYDMQKDPDELHNLAKNQAYADTLNRLKERIKYYQEKTNDPWISKWDHE